MGARDPEALVEAILAFPINDISLATARRLAAESSAPESGGRIEEMIDACVASCPQPRLRDWSVPFQTWLADEIERAIGATEGRHGESALDQLAEVLGAVFDRAHECLGVPFEELPIVKVERNEDSVGVRGIHGWYESLSPPGEYADTWVDSDRRGPREYAEYVASWPGLCPPTDEDALTALLEAGWWPQTVQIAARLRFDPLAALGYTGEIRRWDNLAILAAPDVVLRYILTAGAEAQGNIYAIAEHLLGLLWGCERTFRAPANRDLARSIQDRVARLLLPHAPYDAIGVLAELDGYLETPLDVLLARTRSDDFRVRAWGARAVRNKEGDERAAVLLSHLRHDPYFDEELGQYPVRADAGFESA